MRRIIVSVLLPCVCNFQNTRGNHETTRDLQPIYHIAMSKGAECHVRYRRRYLSHCVMSGTSEKGRGLLCAALWSFI